MLTERKAIEQAIQWNRSEITSMREASRILTEQNFLHTKRLRELDEYDRVHGQVIALDPNAIIPILVEQSRLMAELIEERASKKDLMLELSDMMGEETVTTRRTFTQTSEESTTTTKTKRNDFKKQAPTVASILKSFGRPVSLSDIVEKMELDHDAKWGFPTNAMDSIIRFDPRISRVGHGTYQYKL
jgi:hypothetical protein